MNPLVMFPSTPKLDRELYKTYVPKRYQLKRRNSNTYKDNIGDI